MLAIISLAAIMGGLVTATLTYPLGLAVSFMAAPVGGSVSALLVASIVAMRRTHASAQKPSVIGSRADAQSPRGAQAHKDPI